MLLNSDFTQFFCNFKFKTMIEDPKKKEIFVELYSNNCQQTTDGRLSHNSQVKQEILSTICVNECIHATVGM